MVKNMYTYWFWFRDVISTTHVITWLSVSQATHTVNTYLFPLRILHHIVYNVHIMFTCMCLCVRVCVCVYVSVCVWVCVSIRECACTLTLCAESEWRSVGASGDRAALAGCNTQHATLTTHPVATCVTSGQLNSLHNTFVKYLRLYWDYKW